MSFPPHGRGRAMRPRGSEEEFVLFLQGIPARCRWQELKDFVRQTALHIRQAVVYDDAHGFPTGLGQIIVKNEEEAWRTYHRLSTNGWEGQSLVVTLARTSAPTQPIAGPTKSPCVILPTFVAGYSTPPRDPHNMAVPPSPLSAEAVMPSSPSYYNSEYGLGPSPMAVPHQTFVPIFTEPSCHLAPALPNSPLQPAFCDPMGFSIVPTYGMSHHMRQPAIAPSIRQNHVNIPTPRKGLYNYQTPKEPTYPRPDSRRAILIQNLDPATTLQDLHDLLHEVVSVEHCEILPTSVSFSTQIPRHRVIARVILPSAEEAKRAVVLYDNSLFMGSKIRVKIDRSIFPNAASYNLAADYSLPHSSFPRDSLSRIEQMQFTPPTTDISASGSDSDEQSPRHEHAQRKTEKPPTPASDSSPAPNSGAIDRCQPLVVNGSIGTRAAVAI
ncbi:hypothetical protein BJX61DRAFT_98772 [Aspergillus egyptiacus]|nr:hypothetical protein BJX61DRAFT_98772 [Aspergillus egyptiacus]